MGPSSVGELSAGQNSGSSASRSLKGAMEAAPGSHCQDPGPFGLPPSPPRLCVGPNNPLPSLSCPRHRKGRGWSIQDPCHECLALAFQAPLHSVQLQVSIVAQEPVQCNPCSGLVCLEGVLPPGPSGARALGAQSGSSLSLACPRHRGGRWSVQNPCEDCISLAFAATL